MSLYLDGCSYRKRWRFNKQSKPWAFGAFQQALKQTHSEVYYNICCLFSRVYHYQDVGRD